jgi:hypothetical protein
MKTLKNLNPGEATTTLTYTFPAGTPVSTRCPLSVRDRIDSLGTNRQQVVHELMLFRAQAMDCVPVPPKEMSNWFSREKARRGGAAGKCPTVSKMLLDLVVEALDLLEAAKNIGVPVAAASPTDELTAAKQALVRAQTEFDRLMVARGLKDEGEFDILSIFQD